MSYSITEQLEKIQNDGDDAKKQTTKNHDKKRSERRIVESAAGENNDSLGGDTLSMFTEDDARSQSFYHNASFLAQALQKRPSIFDLNVNNDAPEPLNEAENKENNSKSKKKVYRRWIDKMFGGEKPRKSQINSNANEVVSNGTPNITKTNKEDEALFLLEYPNEYIESYAPTDIASINKLKEVYNTKEKSAVELTDSTRFWKKVHGFRDMDKYEKDKYRMDEHLMSQLVVFEVQHNITWRNVEIPTTKNECCTNLHVLIRKGIPERRRRKVWKLVTGAKDLMKQSPHFYEIALNNVFGSTRLPNRHVKVPTFGGKLEFENLYLTDEGIQVAKRLLCIIAMEHPNVYYTPMLPNLVSIFLHFMDENEVYACIYQMLMESNKNQWYFHTTKKEHLLFLFAFKKIVLTNQSARNTSLGLDSLVDGIVLSMS